jgi:hypothetical protein
MASLGASQQLGASGAAAGTGGLVPGAGPPLAEGFVVEAPPKFRSNSALKDLDPNDAMGKHADAARKAQFDHQEVSKLKDAEKDQRETHAGLRSKDFAYSGVACC